MTQAQQIGTGEWDNHHMGADSWNQNQHLHQEPACSTIVTSCWLAHAGSLLYLGYIIMMQAEPHNGLP